jgi:hypothetical protein
VFPDFPALRLLPSGEIRSAYNLHELFKIGEATSIDRPFILSEFGLPPAPREVSNVV